MGHLWFRGFNNFWNRDDLMLFLCLLWTIIADFTIFKCLNASTPLKWMFYLPYLWRWPSSGGLSIRKLFFTFTNSKWGEPEFFWAVQFHGPHKVAHSLATKRCELVFHSKPGNSEIDHPISSSPFLDISF